MKITTMLRRLATSLASAAIGTTAGAGVAAAKAERPLGLPPPTAACTPTPAQVAQKSLLYCADIDNLRYIVSPGLSDTRAPEVGIAQDRQVTLAAADGTCPKGKIRITLMTSPVPVPEVSEL